MLRNAKNALSPCFAHIFTYQSGNIQLNAILRSYFSHTPYFTSACLDFFISPQPDSSGKDRFHHLRCWLISHSSSKYSLRLSQKEKKACSSRTQHCVLKNLLLDCRSLKEEKKHTITILISTQGPAFWSEANPIFHPPLNLIWPQIGLGFSHTQYCNISRKFSHFLQFF